MKTSIILLVFILSIPNISFGQYCYPRTKNLHAHHQIQYFQLGNFVNITGDTAIQEYNDFSDSLIIYVEIGKNYELVMSMEPNPFSSMAGNTLGYSIWIDFNNDTIFSNTELVYGQYYGSLYTYVDSVQFTDSLLFGNRRLRVRNEWGRMPDSPCDTLWGGETEDYTINFMNSVGIIMPHLTNNTLIYPNPTEGSFTIDLGKIHKNINVSIANTNGQIIETKMYNQSQIINLNITVPTGLYFVIIKTENDIKVVKLIKK